MLERIEIGNFKAFGDIQTIDIKPLTLLFGGNSSGKSTILQSLIYLSEAIKTLDWDVLTTLQGGSYMDFGGLKNVVHQKDSTKTIHFGFTISGIRIISPVHFKEDGISFSTDEFRSWFFNQRINRTAISTHELEDKLFPYYDCTFTFRFGIDPIETSDIEIQSDRLRYFSIIEEKVDLISFPDQTRQSVSIKPNKLILDIVRIHKDLLTDEKQYIFNELKPVSRFFLKKYLFDEKLGKQELNFIDSLNSDSEYQSYYKSEITKLGVANDYDQFFALWIYTDLDEITDPFYQVFSHEINTINSLIGFGPNVDDNTYPLESTCNLSTYLASIEHLGYFRPVPDRMIYDSQTKDFKNNNINAVWQKLLTTDWLREKVNSYLSDPDKLDMGYKLFVQKWNSESDDSDKPRSISTLEITDLQTDTIVNLRELGQGVIQIIPILTAILDPNKPFVSIEQPELHLHPALQVRLAQIIAENSHDREVTREIPSENSEKLTFSEIEKGKKFLIETHSEHIIKAIQLYFIKSRELSKEDINILYVKRDYQKPQSVIRKFSLDETGSFGEAFPDDFFELSADLTLERLKSYYKGTN